MGVNKAVEDYFTCHISDEKRIKLHLEVELNKVPIKKKLKDITPADWPKDSCITCRWWIAVSKEYHLGECHNNVPRRGHKNPEIPEYAMTPPNDFCKHHWGRGEYSKAPTHMPSRR
jgi:hypothetical protein